MGRKFQATFNFSQKHQWRGFGMKVFHHARMTIGLTHSRLLADFSSSQNISKNLKQSFECSAFSLPSIPGAALTDLAV